MYKKIYFYLIIIVTCGLFIYRLFPVFTEMQVKQERNNLWHLKHRAGNAVNDLVVVVAVTAGHFKELPPNSVSELVIWLNKDQNLWDCKNNNPFIFRVDNENKIITGIYGETIDFYKNDDGSYIIISYGKNNICENGDGDDYLLEYDKSFDKIIRHGISFLK